MTTPTVVRDRDNCSVCGLTRRVLKAGVVGQHVVTGVTHAPCKGSKRPPADFAPVVYIVVASGELTRAKHQPPHGGAPRMFDVPCSRGDLRGFNEALRAMVKSWPVDAATYLQHQGSLLAGRLTERPAGYDGPVGRSLVYTVAGLLETDIPRGPYVEGPWAGRVRALEPSEPAHVRQMGVALGRYERDGECWRWVPAFP